MLKKLTHIALCATAVILLTGSSAWALGLGGLSYNIGPSFSLGAGVGWSMRDIYVIENNDITDEMTSGRFLVKANVAPIKYVDVYGLLGVSDLQLDDGDFEGTLGTIWGVGLRPQLFPLTWQSPLNITLDGQYAEVLTRDDTVAARMNELQVSLIFAYVMRSLTPYGGVKYDRMVTHFDGSENDVIGDMEWGTFIGCDYFVTQNVFFGLELSIFTETAFFLSTGYKY
jgi:hypothetical protein